MIREREIRFEVAASFQRWADAIRDGLRSMQVSGHLTAAANPDGLAVALLAALQGGLLLGQVQRSTRPLRIALDAMLTLIETHAVGEHGRVDSADSAPRLTATVAVGRAR